MNIKPIFTNFIYNKKPALPNVHAAGSIKAENRINNKNVNSAASNYFKKFTDKIKRLITYFKSMIVKIDKTEVKRISKLPVDQFCRSLIQKKSVCCTMLHQTLFM